MFPLNTEPTADSTDAFLISFNPSSQFYALLSRNSVSIYNNLDSLFPKVFSFIRDTSSLQSYGPNHWFQWITENSFAFGTFTGNIFFFNSFSQNEPILYSIDSIITSSFSAYGYLAVCVKGPIIYFFKESNFYSKIEIELTFPFIKDSKFHSNSMLSIMLNNQPYVCHLSNVMIQSKWKITFKKLNVENSTNLSLNPKLSNVAYSTQDGSVYICSLYNQSFNLNFNSSENQNLNKKEQIFESGSEVVHLFWLNDFSQLCAIKRGGELFLWNFDDNSSFCTTIRDLADVDSLEFDSVTKTLLCINGKCLINISFCTLDPPLCLTSSSLYMISTGKKIASIHKKSHSQFDDVVSLPPEIFPISKAVESSESDLAIYGGDRLVVITENKLFLTKITDITAICWCNQKLYVFSTSTKTKSRLSSSNLTIFTKELVKMGSISSPHIASTVSASPENDRIIISNRHYLTVFDFDASKSIQKPPSSKFQESHIGWEDFTLTITTFTIPEPIINAVCGLGNELWLHLKIKTSAGSSIENYNFDYIKTIHKKTENDTLKQPNQNDNEKDKNNDINIDDNIIVRFPSFDVIETNADKMWNQTRLNLLFIEKSNTVKIFSSSNSQLFSFEINYVRNKNDNIISNFIEKKSDKPLCSMGSDFVFLNSNLVFGTFPFITIDFAFRIIQDELSKNIQRCFIFAKSLSNLANFNSLMSQLCAFSLQKGKIVEYAQLMRMFGSKEALKILSSFDKNILAVLMTTLSIDNEEIIEVSELFCSFDTESQVQILTTSSPSEFLRIIHNNNYKKQFFKNEKIQYLSRIIDSLIMSMEWSKLERFCIALLDDQIEIDLPSKLMSFTELGALQFDQTLKIIEKDNFKWNNAKIKNSNLTNEQQNQKELLKNLGFAFTAADFGQWAAACFSVTGDENKTKFILLDKPEIINDVDKFINDKDNINQEQMISFLRNIIDGIKKSDI